MDSPPLTQEGISLKSTTMAFVLVVSAVLTLGPAIINRCIMPMCSKRGKCRSCIKHNRKLEALTNLLQALAGGILLAGGLMHLIPESAETISAVLTSYAAAAPVPPEGTNSTESATTTAEGESEGPWYAIFPWAMFLAGSCIILLFVMETLVSAAVVSLRKKKSIKHSRFFDCCLKVTTEAFTWLSLSLHSLSLGYAFGAENHPYRMWTLFAGIVAHHFFESLAFGFLLDKAFGKRSKIVLTIFALTFSISIPLGIGIGLGISSVQDENPGLMLAQAFILAFSAGALLYVALFEILMGHQHLPEEESVSEKPKPVEIEKELSQISIGDSATPGAETLSQRAVITVDEKQIASVDASTNSSHSTHQHNFAHSTPFNVARFTMYIIGFALMSSLAAFE